MKTGHSGTGWSQAYFDGLAEMGKMIFSTYDGRGNPSTKDDEMGAWVEERGSGSLLERVYPPPATENQFPTSLFFCVFCEWPCVGNPGCLYR